MILGLNLDSIFGSGSSKPAGLQRIWRIRIPRLNLDLVPKSCKDVVNQVAWGIRFPKLNLDLVPKIMQKKSKPGSLEDQDPKSKISKINFASWIRGFCRHLSHPFFVKDQDPKTESRFSPKIMQIRCKPGGLEDKDPKLNVDLVPKSCKNNQNQVVWRIRIRKVRFPKLVLHRGLEAFVDICIHLSHPFFLKDQDPKTESRFSPKIMQQRICMILGLNLDSICGS